MTSVIALDQDWQGGRYTRNPVEGPRLAGMAYYPWTVSAAYLDRLPAAQLAKEIEDTARAFANWDANSLVLCYAASRAHNASGPFGGDLSDALAQITAPTLVLPSASDRLPGSKAPVGSVTASSRRAMPKSLRTSAIARRSPGWGLNRRPEPPWSTPVQVGRRTAERSPQRALPQALKVSRNRRPESPNCCK